MHQDTTSNHFPEKAIRLREVCSRIGMSRTHLYRLVGRGLFPAPVRLSERVSVWREADVNGWLQQKFSTSNAVISEASHGR